MNQIVKNMVLKLESIHMRSCERDRVRREGKRGRKGRVTIRMNPVGELVDIIQTFGPYHIR